ncbi:MAG: magnesium/cobalt transporter CorA [Bacillota bacterium]
MRALLMRGDEMQVLQGSDAEAFAVEGRPEDGAQAWLDVDATEVSRLAEPWGLHRLAVEDCQDQSQRPKLDEYETHSFLVVNVARDWSGRRIHIDELDMFVGDSYLLTSHQGVLPALDAVFDGVAQGSHHPPVGEMLYKLLDAAVDSFFPALDDIGDELEVLEEQILSRRDRGAMEKLFVLKRKLLRIRKVLLPQRDLIHSLTVRDVPVVDQKLKRYIVDVYDHAMRLAELAETYRDLVSSALEAHLSAVANRTNGTMKVLAAVSVIFLPLTLISGIYGMNFDNIPLRSAPYGFHLVVTAMVLIMVGLAYYFRRKGWL